MNNKIVQHRILFISLLFIMAIGVVFAMKFQGAYEEPQGLGGGLSNDANPKGQDVINKPIEPEVMVYADQYIAGFEEDMRSIVYELKYTPDKAAIQSKGSEIFIREKESGQIGTLTIFYNGASGFTSTQHFWQEMKLCPDCRRISPTLDFGESKDLVMYSNGQKEWAVFEREPGFIIAEYYVASGDIKSVITSLNMTVHRTDERPIFQDIDIFFIDTNPSDTHTCTSTARLVRGVVKTPKIGTAALLELFEGPTEEEKKQGFFSMLPDDLWLNALTIKDGIATVDVSKQMETITNACYMEGAVAQIEQTILQFPGVEKVDILVDGKNKVVLEN